MNLDNSNSVMDSSSSNNINRDDNDTAMDVDLNLEPNDITSDGEVDIETFRRLYPLTSAHRERRMLYGLISDEIQERHRLLQAQYHHRLREARILHTNQVVDIVAREPEGLSGIGREEERGRSCKRDNAHLVATEMEVDLEVTKEDGGNGGGFFDCSICLEMAKDPILTCCGHLFCWACYYQVDSVEPGVKECPVCKGQVTDANVTPIYGNANNENVVSEVESGLKIPPRPTANRVESVRQQRVNRTISQVPVVEALRRIRIGIGIDQPRQRDPGSANAGSNSTSQVLPTTEARSMRRLRSRQIASLFSDSASAVSSVSSFRGLDEDYARLLQTTGSHFVPLNDRGFSSSVAVIQTELQTVDSTTETTLPSAPVPLDSYVELSFSDTEDVPTRRTRRRRFR